MLRESQRKSALKLKQRPKLSVPQTRAKNEVVPNDGTYVTVCCKFPMSLRLRVYEMADVEERGPSGTRTIKQARQIGGPDNCVIIRGYNRSQEHFQAGLVNPGYAMTRDVPTAFWRLWLEQNCDSDLLLNHLIFAHKQQASVHSFIREHESNLCGLEPLQPTPCGGLYGPPPKPVDARLKALRFAPTTATHE